MFIVVPTVEPPTWNPSTPAVAAAAAAAASFFRLYEEIFLAGSDAPVEPPGWVLLELLLEDDDEAKDDDDEGTMTLVAAVLPATSSFSLSILLDEEEVPLPLILEAAPPDTIAAEGGSIANGRLGSEAAILFSSKGA